MSVGLDWKKIYNWYLSYVKYLSDGNGWLTMCQRNLVYKKADIVFVSKVDSLVLMKHNIQLSQLFCRNPNHD